MAGLQSLNPEEIYDQNEVSLSPMEQSGIKFKLPLL